MFRFLPVAFVCAAAMAQSPKFGVGRPPTAEEVKSMNLTVFPDGTGLPEGGGTAIDGKGVYERRCQKCHGAEGKGGDEAPLAGGQGTLATPKPLKTVGSYWPYATTLFDYIRRSMPFNQPGTLTNDQIYAAAAYVLHVNGIIGGSDRMDAKSLPQVKMPNKDGFVEDGRPDTGKRRKSGK